MMKKTFCSLLALVAVLLSAMPVHGQYYNAPKFAYDKFKAYLKREIDRTEPGKYKAFYYITPYQGGVENTPVIGILGYDYDNQKVTLFEYGLKYNDDGDIVFASKEIPMAYTSPTFVAIQGGEYYIIQDMEDGRGLVARRNYSFTKEPVDRGPLEGVKRLLSSGWILECYPPDDLEALEDAFSRFR